MRKHGGGEPQHAVEPTPGQPRYAELGHGTWERANLNWQGCLLPSIASLCMHALTRL